LIEPENYDRHSARAESRPCAGDCCYEGRDMTTPAGINLKSTNEGSGYQAKPPWQFSTRLLEGG
jgi:hypothetical protein